MSILISRTICNVSERILSSRYGILISDQFDCQIESRHGFRVLDSSIVLNPTKSLCVTLYDVVSRHVALQHNLNVTSHRVTSHQVTSRHVTLRHVISRHVTSRHVTSHHVASRHVALLHNATQCCVASLCILSQRVKSCRIARSYVASRLVASCWDASRHPASRKYFESYRFALRHVAEVFLIDAS